MTGRVFTIKQPTTDWVCAVAMRVMEVAPATHPLEAVRCAIEALPEFRHQDPRAAADALIEASARRAADRSVADRR